MQFSTKILQNNRLAHPSREYASPSGWKILEPPLKRFVVFMLNQIKYFLIFQEKFKFAFRMLFRRCPCRCVQKATYKDAFSDIHSEASVKTAGKAAPINDPDTRVQVNGGRAKKYMRVSDLETEQSYL